MGSVGSVGSVVWGDGASHLSPASPPRSHASSSRGCVWMLLQAVEMVFSCVWMLPTTDYLATGGGDGLYKPLGR